MINYSEKEIKSIYSNPDFIQKLSLKNQNDELNQLITFLNSIKLNTKYYRLTTNKNNGKYKKLISSDTVFLKDLNSILNKLTDNNLQKLSDKIKTRINDKNHLKLMITRNILEKSSVHMSYISVYVDLLTKIYDNIDSSIIQGILDDMYQSIHNKNINTDQSEYLQFCDKNKKLDLYIGYSLLITELEKSNIISNKIKPTIETLIDLLNKNEDDSERYKCSQCLYNILKSLFGTDELSDEYSIIINKLISEEKTMKIKFKFMDIIERK